MTVTVLHGDCRDVLRTIDAESINCVVTSPPYFGLRDYNVDGQLGLEKTPQDYVDSLVDVFREVWRVLRSDGTVWLNLGDSFAGAGYSNHKSTGGAQRSEGGKQRHLTGTGLRPKNLIGIPWRVALALQGDGWILRSDIIWAKSNPLPESVKDRPTKSHEHIFLLAKSEKYYYDADAIGEPVSEETVKRLSQPTFHQQTGGPKDYAITGQNANRSSRKTLENLHRSIREQAGHRIKIATRNKRDVWTIPARPYKGAHFAVFPEKLVEPCILAGCPRDGVVLDPFAGSGTTLAVAAKHGRHAVGIELNPDYIDLIHRRIAATPVMLPLDDRKLA